MPRKPPIATLPARVKRFILDNALARPGETWLVGVSGGPDSVCLLHLLSQIRKELGLSLHAVHLDHGLRGEEAAADARYVGDISDSLNVPFSSSRKDVPAFQKQHRGSLEEAAREVRYLFFQEEAQARKASAVALGHTLDDQAETVLLHLIRGAGGRGLQGMGTRESWHSPVTGATVTVIRPLLEITRAETGDYCQRHGLVPRADSSNRSLRFQRNRVRWELVPLLKTFNPRVQETLVRTARLISQEQAALASVASPLVARFLRSEDGKVSIDVRGLLAQPVGLQRYLLRAAYGLLCGHLRDLEATHIEKMRTLLPAGAGRRISLPGAVVFQKDYQTAWLSPSTGELLSAGDTPASLPVPGETLALGHRWRTRLVSPLDINLHQLDPYRVCLDARITGQDLVVRTRRPGDRFQPLGMAGEKKLQDFMVDAHIPQRRRATIPLVCSPRQILWVVGYRPDDRARVTDGTSEVLMIQAEKITGLEDWKIGRLED